MALPKRCWKCGAAENLWRRDYTLDVRSFEFPLEIGGSALGLFAFFGLIFIVFPKLFWFMAALFVGVGAALALWMKSWVEELRVSLWTCPEHAADLKLPGAAIDQNELYLFLPTDQLALRPATNWRPCGGKRPPDAQAMRRGWTIRRAMGLDRCRKRSITPRPTHRRSPACPNQTG